MSSLQSALASLLQYNYMTLAVLTAVGYDYVLTFSDEIIYIWSKPWSNVSTLYILTRYCGLYVAVTSSLIGSSFFSGSPKLCFEGEKIYISYYWVSVLFTGSANFLFLLRIWAMYDRSRLILGIFLPLLVGEIITGIVAAAVGSVPKRLAVTATEILDFSFCSVTPISPIWVQVTTGFQLSLNTVMCLLAVIKFVRLSLRMLREVDIMNLGPLMDLLVDEHALYFFAISLYGILNVLDVSGKLPTEGWRSMLALALKTVPIVTLTPRFTMNVRELYERVYRSREVDTGFGLSSSDHGATETATAFADAGRNDNLLEDVEEIQMEMRNVGTSQPN